jgi:hypothetical protein
MVIDVAGVAQDGEAGRPALHRNAVAGQEPRQEGGRAAAPFASFRPANELGKRTSSPQLPGALALGEVRFPNPWDTPQGRETRRLPTTRQGTGQEQATRPFLCKARQTRGAVERPVSRERAAEQKELRRGREAKEPSFFLPSPARMRRETLHRKARWGATGGRKRV